MPEAKEYPQWRIDYHAMCKEFDAMTPAQKVERLIQYRDEFPQEHSQRKPIQSQIEYWKEVIEKSKPKPSAEIPPEIRDDEI